MKPAPAIGAMLALLSAWPSAAQDDFPVLTRDRLASLTPADLTACNGVANDVPRFRSPDPEDFTGDPASHRRGRVLSVGRARFRDHPFAAETLDGESHGYIGRYAGAPVVLLMSAQGEGWGYTLVDPATGAVAETAALPLLGPDGHTFLGVSREEDYHAPAIELTEWRGGRLTMTVFWVRGCGFAWAGPGRITYRLGFDGHGDASIDRENGRWVVHSPEPPTEAPSEVATPAPAP